ncbi:MAG: hypothetical protein J5916_00025, partial [Oscillospiraceae bacterium]|nr:hypothetical protein [Oscillospiraceae bacterium]
MTHHLSCDLETFSKVSIKDAGAYRYIADPSFEILLFAYSLDGAPVEIIDLASGEHVPDWLIRALYDPSSIKHAYNAPFEIGCLSKYYGRLDPSQWRDTMIHGLYAGYTAGLDATGKALGLPADKQKLATGKALIRYFCVPCKPTKSNGGRTRNYPKHDPEKWELFKEYCRQDVVTEMEIDRRLATCPVPEFVQKQWETDLRINSRGAAVDLPFVEGALDIADRVKTQLMDEACMISGLSNPNSVAQLMGWINDRTGRGLTDLRKDTVAKILDDGDDPVDPKTYRMLQIRQELGKTSTKKYNAIETCVCPDGRVRGLLQFYGANRTGRFAGRLIQVQNLPRTYTDPIELARELVTAHDADALQCVYGSVNDTLSQLIRTAFVASPGNVLIDADFSAIEARVISWLAGEQWRLEVFRTHGKIYEASASQMFGVPMELIKKGNPEYALRAKGKVAELALGYQGGPGALIAMGALDMGLTEEELPEIVQRWRASNKRIQALWWAMDEAARNVIENGGAVNVRGLIVAREYDAMQGTSLLTITLPSKRKLYYVNPQLCTNRFGGDSMSYTGIDQTTKQWKTIETYGGKLTENCLTGDAKVITDHGVKYLVDVTLADKLWDGDKWVSHDGVIRKGRQQVIDVNGVRMTPDHRILTDRGWICASQSERYNGPKVGILDGDLVLGIEREKVPVEYTVRMWKEIYYAGQRISERKTEVVRVHARGSDFKEADEARHVRHSNLERMELNDGAVQKSECSGMGELRRTRNFCLFGVGDIREFLQRYEGHVSAWADAGQDRCERAVREMELQMGNSKRAGTEQAEHGLHDDPRRKNEGQGSSRKVRDQLHDAAVSYGARLADRFDVHSCGHKEQSVYDIMNAGPDHRFAVISDRGLMIVHNCVQAIARDCLCEAIERLEAAGFP